MPRRSTVIAAVAAAAVAAPAAAQCSTPAAGANITLQPCSGAGASVAWFYNTSTPGGLGSFSLANAPGLCIGLLGVYAPSGATQARLLPCDPNDYSQRWAWNLPSQPPTQLYNGLTGEVMDAFNNEVTPGTVIEVFSPNGGANQAYTFKPTGPASAGQLLSALDSNGNTCVSVC